MNHVEMKDRILSLSQLQAQQERIINDLIQSMVDLDMDSFESILDSYIKARGIERSITQIIFPFLEKIGILWATNHINPAQEHLVTNIIRQKLIVGIENSNTHMHVNKSILLFLPEGEHHELGLLFIYYLLRSRGVKVLYLGANVPLKDVEYLVKVKNPDIAYTHLTSLANNFNFDKFMNSLSCKVKGVPIVVSGQVTQQYRKSAPQGIHLKRSLSEVMEYIATL
jgi:methanogenic corrinoid protein MtbC1